VSRHLDSKSGVDPNVTRLIFMTYNGYIIIAVTVGAGIGYYIYGSDVSATRDSACH
jgi:hypothetical protein